MQLMKTIKANTGRYFLRKRLRHFSRERKCNNLETAKTVGILFKTEGPASIESVKNFLNYLEQFKLQIYTLGFVDSKSIPESLLFSKGINLFSKKELGYWSMIPKTPVAEDFMEKPFDILIDLCTENTFPVEYISSLSKAKFKVGKFSMKNEAYDMMFDIETGTSIEEYVGYLKTYLNMLNKQN
jgi:hypothetical protein